MTTATPPVADDLAPHRWTREEYHRLGESGAFPESDKWELLDGEIYPKMPQGKAHITAVRAVVAALRAIFGEGFDVNAQLPLPLSEHSEPEPDVLVLRGSWRDYDGRDPDLREDVILAVEVSDSSLNRDQGLKARLYAASGVGEYWIVDLRHRTLEVRRRPHAEGYGETLVLREGESATVGGGAVAVADVLPKASA